METIKNTRQAEFRLEQKLAAACKFPIKRLKKEYKLAKDNSEGPLGCYPALSDINYPLSEAVFHSTEAKEQLINLFDPVKAGKSKLVEEYLTWYRAYDNLDFYMSVYIGSTLWMMCIAEEGAQFACSHIRIETEANSFFLIPFKQWFGEWNI